MTPRLQNNAAGQPCRSESLVDLVGNTPLLRLTKFETSGRAAIWAKLESANPGGSVKDRIALSMIRAAEAAGALKSGGGRYLRAHIPHVHLAAVEPTASAVLSGGSPASHTIQGIGAGFIPAVLERSLLDQVVCITDGEAISTCINLNRHRISAGISSGANVAAAQQVAAGFDAGCNVVTTICDGVERYLSANLFA